MTHNVQGDICIFVKDVNSVDYVVYNRREYQILSGQVVSVYCGNLVGQEVCDRGHVLSECQPIL